MVRNILFTEKQVLTVWVFIILLLPLCFLIYGLFQQTVLDKPFGDDPVDNVTLTVLIAVFALIIFFLRSIFLETKVTNDGISINFNPFLKKIYLWNEIENISIERYSPMKDYLGWGIRLNSKGTAYTIKGNIGIRITLVNGEKILIGTKELSNSILNTILVQLNLTEKLKY